jgi:hypothetical protein
MSHAASLSKSDLRRLERLAEDVGTTPISTEEVLSVIEEQRASRGRKSSAAA